MMVEVRFENEKNRAAAYSNGELIGECTFFGSESLWAIDHTYVDNQYRGQGIAQALLKSVMDEARKGNIRIDPVCPFAKREFERVAEYRELLWEHD